MQHAQQKVICLDNKPVLYHLSHINRAINTSAKVTYRPTASAAQYLIFMFMLAALHSAKFGPASHSAWPTTNWPIIISFFYLPTNEMNSTYK